MGDTPLKQVDAETQAIIDTDIDWLIDCDNISLSTTGSNFIVVEDDESIGSFKTTSNRVSFNPVLDVRTFIKDHNNASSKAAVTHTMTNANAFTKTSSAPTHEHSTQHNTKCNDNATMLESARGSANPLASG